MEITEERIHVIKYGILGFLLARDISKPTYINTFIVAFCAGLFVGIVDELFQWILPSRVGDIRDVVIDCISTALGILVLLALRGEHQSQSVKIMPLPHRDT